MKAPIAPAKKGTASRLPNCLANVLPRPENTDIFARGFFRYYFQARWTVQKHNIVTRIQTYYSKLRDVTFLITEVFSGFFPVSHFEKHLISIYQ
jgi:hypothetical protein